MQSEISEITIFVSQQKQRVEIENVGQGVSLPGLKDGKEFSVNLTTADDGCKFFREFPGPNYFPLICWVKEDGMKSGELLIV